MNQKQLVKQIENIKLLIKELPIDSVQDLTDANCTRRVLDRMIEQITNGHITEIRSFD